MPSLDPYHDAKGEKAFFKRMTSLPTVTFTGVVHALGASEGMVQGGDWILHIPVCAWRIDDGSVVSGRLDIHQPRRSKFSPKMSQLKGYEVIRVQAHVDSGHAVPEGPWEIGVSDVQMQEIVDELRKPVVVESRFGPLTLNRRLGEFNGQIEWCGMPTEVCLTTESEDALQGLINDLADFTKKDRQWDRRCRDFTIAHYRESGWNKDGTLSRVIEEEMKLHSINLNTDHTFSLCYESEAFYGHVLYVYGNMTEGPNDAEIAG